MGAQRRRNHSRGCANGTHQAGGDHPSRRPPDADAPIGPRRHRLQARDQQRPPAESLPEFARNGVRGGFRHGRRRSQKPPRLPRRAKSMAQTAAAPRFASTCDALRPSRRSAVPSRCFLDRPTRVATQVTTNSASNAINAGGPAAANKAKQTAAPATVPDRFTPRTAYPRPAKRAVMAPASAKRGPPAAHQLPCNRLISITIRYIAATSSFSQMPGRRNQMRKHQPVVPLRNRVHPVVLFVSIPPATVRPQIAQLTLHSPSSEGCPRALGGPIKPHSA